ncbi:F5/8 type C domain-containing protein [Streptomyces sp. DvalAA-14]|uniref:discoidin domain-containing protein n=1 Tax=unclassified Streptomyces TaxID=2593676 RepID=UPI00081BA788|nr:discoidin domain-containing protein [Streptomyces sp. DvalAA-14]SCE09588.1 F5/8 type C domain-containing protein [Streptomyces sp. DvalAA-14]
MSHDSAGLGRRRFAQLAALTALGTAAPLSFGAGTAAAASAGHRPGQGHDHTTGPSHPDTVAAAYYQALLTHTKWAEAQWDAAAGHYAAADFNFAVVLGNAVLLTRGTYDAEQAGVDQETLRAHTLATVQHFAASNRLTGGTEWGKTLFFDTTFQLYFVLAARLLWDQLDAATQQAVDTLVREQAAYTLSLGTAADPLSAGWTTNGLKGGFVGDTKLEEMGVYAQSLAPALAWAADDPRYADWSASYGVWSRNETGLPAADRANPALVDGVPVSANTAQNLYDTFLVENHNSFGPHYQEELWRTSGRNSVHFITAGRPLPEVLTAQPNADRLWRTIRMVMSDAGEPLMPMVADREHLYGRDVIPLAFLAQVGGDRAAAWAEAALAARLAPYQAYPPLYQLAKFSGEAKYEPEARAEVAISYLLHEWRAAHGGIVQPLSDREMFHQAAGVRDFGTGPGLVAHQTPNAWAAAVTKPGFVKFAWQPAHDDWLFALSGTTAMFLPSVGGKVLARRATLQRAARDGLDTSATLLTLDTGYAGFTTLPSGAVVYATTGTAPGEGHLQVQNLTMPGVAGLDGSRTYTAAEAVASVASQDSGKAGVGPGPRVDTVTFPRATWRHVRMQGITGHPTYGYSLYALEVRDGDGAADQAQGGTATASSADTGKGPELAVDGNAGTRWAVAVAQRTKPDSWLAVDLGADRSFDRVTLRWETAAGSAYRVQGSADGLTWTDLVRFPAADLTSTGGWLSVDGRAGLVVRGAANPLAVYGDLVVLSDGPAEPLLVEGLPSGDPKALAAAARQPAPSTAHPAVVASTAGGHLSLFNLSGSAVTTAVAVAQDRSRLTLFAGAQVVTAGGTEYTAVLGAACAQVAAARFTLRAAARGGVPTGVRAEVVDAATVRLDGPRTRLILGTPDGRQVTAEIRPGRTSEVTVPHATPYPLPDAAIGQDTFPSAPLPPGMSDPAAAVDGNPATSWRPGPGGRMVVDLGAPTALREIRAAWTGGRVPEASIALSADGLTYQDAGILRGRGRDVSLTTTATARYVALTVSAQHTSDARVASLTVTPA